MDKPNTLVVDGTFSCNDGRNLALQWQKAGAAAIYAEFLYHPAK